MEILDADVRAVAQLIEPGLESESGATMAAASRIISAGYRSPLIPHWVILLIGFGAGTVVSMVITTMLLGGK